VGNQAVLGRQHYLVASVGDRAADQLLVDVGPVDLGGVEQGDSEVERPVDRADRLVVVALGCRIGRGHAHRAEADPADLDGAQMVLDHVDRLPCLGECGTLGHPQRDLACPASSEQGAGVGGVCARSSTRSTTGWMRPFVTGGSGTVVLIALAVTGVLSACLGGSPAGRAVIRVLIGGSAGLALTYGIGHLFGAAIS